MKTYVIGLITAILLGLLIFRNWYGIIFGLLTLGIFIVAWSIFREFNISNKVLWYILIALVIIISALVATTLINSVMNQPLSYGQGILGGSSIIILTIFIVFIVAICS